MAINSTGRRVLVNKGIYDSTLQYYPMDAVYYEESYYICIKACVGIDPTDTNYWGYSHSLGDIAVSLGIRLSDGILYITDTVTTEDLGKVSILYRGEYSSTATYASLDVVTYEGSSYICIKDTTGNLPTDTTYFGLLCEGTEGRGITSVTLSENKHLVVAYTDGTSKDIGEVVIHTPLDQIDAASINSDGHLILSKDDGTTLDAGYVRGPEGPTGPRGERGEDAPREAVLFVTQTLTTEQQTQARTNIGAASAEETNRLSEEMANKQTKGEYVKTVNGIPPNSEGNVVVIAGETVPPGSITLDMLSESTLDAISEGISEEGTSLTIYNKRNSSIPAIIKTVNTDVEGVFTHSGKNVLDMRDGKFEGYTPEKYDALTGTIYGKVRAGNGLYILVDKKTYIAHDTFYTYSGVYSPGGIGRLLVRAYDSNDAQLSSGVTVNGGYYLSVYGGWIAEVNPTKIKIDSTVAYIKLGAVWLTTVNGTNYSDTIQSYSNLQLEEGEAKTEFAVGYQIRETIGGYPTDTKLVPGNNKLSSDVIFSVQYNPYAPAVDTEIDIKDITDYVTPQMYGAQGDGMADDTVAIQTALDENKVVFFPEGEYLITSALNVGDGRVLFSNNFKTTKIKAVGCDAVHIANKAGGGAIKNIGFLGDDSAHRCITFNQNVGWIFDRLYITNFGKSFFYADSNGFVSNIYISNGIFMYGGENCVHMQHIVLQDRTGSQINCVVVEKCLIEYFNDGITLTGTANTVKENVIEFCERGIVVDTGVSNAVTTEEIIFSCVYGMSIVGNYFEGITDSCVYVRALNDVERQVFGFIDGINIVGNYMRMAENVDTETAIIKFRKYMDIYIITMSISHLRLAMRLTASFFM